MFIKNKRDKNNNHDNKYKYLIIGIIILLIIILIIIKFKSKQNNYYLVLNGDTDLIIKQYSIYEEAGFKANDEAGNDLTNQVEIIGEVNSSIAGEYKIIYKLNNIIEERNILVVPEENQVTYLILSGQSTMFLKVGETYIEPGYTVIDNIENNLSNKVKVTGEVNTNNPGTYKINYSVTNKSGEIIQEERTIIVMDSKINITYTPTKATKENVIINISVNDNYFDYLMLPNNTKITSRTATYTVEKNGVYEFVIYSKDGSSKKQQVIIENIDKVPPKIISCTGIINDDKITYHVKTNDTDINKYVYNNKYTTTSKTYTINEKIQNATLTVYDYAGNEAQVKCKTNQIVKPPIAPNESKDIIKQAESETLKFWIEKKTRSGGRPSFYLARIWVKDAYNQLKSGVPNNFGKETLYPADILKQKINKLGLQNKLAIAVNGSAFVSLEGGFSTNIYYRNKAFNNTSVGPVVISEGKILRDLTNGKFERFVTYGLTKENKLEYYDFYPIVSEKEKEKNKKTMAKIIADGVKNTWAFLPIFIYNGKALAHANTTDQNLRTAFCQIDENNYVLVTDSFSSPRRGFSFAELQKYMLSLGCQVGVNLDGGGSIALIYKDKNTTNPTVVRGNGRKVADILYFHE